MAMAQDPQALQLLKLLALIVLHFSKRIRNRWNPKVSIHNHSG